MTDGLIDLMVPYAGSGQLLRETVESVLRQDDPAWCLTVIEDGAHDPSVADWLASLDDDRVRYLRNEQTLGVAGNFQRCLESATADFVVVLGCDDLLGPSYVSTVRRSLRRHPDVDVVQPGVDVVDAAGRPTRPLGDRIKNLIAPKTELRVHRGQSLLTSLMLGNWTYFPSLCWRREAVVDPGFRQDLTTVLDLDLLARLILAGSGLLTVPEVVFRYRRHAASVSSQTARSTARFAEERAVMDDIATRADQLGWHRAARAARLSPTSRLHAAMLLPGALGALDRAAARRLAQHAFA